MQTSDTRAMDTIFQETWAVLEMHFLTRPHLMSQAREELARYLDSLPDGRGEQHMLKNLACRKIQLKFGPAPARYE